MLFKETEYILHAVADHRPMAATGNPESWAQIYLLRTACPAEPATPNRNAVHYMYAPSSYSIYWLVCLQRSKNLNMLGSTIEIIPS